MSFWKSVRPVHERDSVCTLMCRFASGLHTLRVWWFDGRRSQVKGAISGQDDVMKVLGIFWGAWKQSTS